MTAKLCVLDPIRVSYHRDENWLIMDTLVTWLPGHYPYFMDDPVYRATFGGTAGPTGTDDILGIRTPVSLGGVFEPDNFQIGNIHTYFPSTAAIYSKLLVSGVPKKP